MRYAKRMTINNQRHILFICPDTNEPCGGIKEIYRFVDILNDMGLAAYVVHDAPRFRCTWFENRTPIVYTQEFKKNLQGPYAGRGIEAFSPTEHDIFVVPELLIHLFLRNRQDLKSYIVSGNQNTYYTFANRPLAYGAENAEHQDVSPYRWEKMLGALVVSEDNKSMLEFTFPDLAIYHIHLSVDYDLFNFQVPKDKIIAFMPRRRDLELQQVLWTLKERDRLHDWKFISIHGISEKEVANKLKSAALFLSFSHMEGFGLPPFEALASGCTVIGFHGQGGKEFIREPYAYPIEEGDTLAFAKKIEEIALDYEQRPDYYFNRAKEIRRQLKEQYSQERKLEDLRSAWSSILKEHDKRINDNL